MLPFLKPQLPNTASHRPGFSITEGREAKAAKIRAVIEAVRGPLKSTDNILDVGTGSGGIAAALGAKATVYATDRTDQRTERDGFSFALADEYLPFADGTFDVVISNHVIEHVLDPERHLAEIRRVVKSSGMCYLATPNRWWPIEVHSHLPLLHWLPVRFFQRLASATDRLPEPVHPLSLRALGGLCQSGFTIDVWHDRVVLQPQRYSLQLPRWASAILKRVPERFVHLTRRLHPTLIVVLRPPKPAPTTDALAIDDCLPKKA